MNRSKIIRRVKSKINFLNKVKDIKNMLLNKKYTTLNDKNAIAFAKNLGKKHYWGFDVKDNAKTDSSKYQGVSIINVEIEPKEENSLGNELAVWFDPVVGELVGDFRKSLIQHAKHRPEFHFKPLTEENAIAYTKTIDGIKFDPKRKTKKVKQNNYPMIEVPILSNGEENTFMVWYDPGFMGLYGEW